MPAAQPMPGVGGAAELLDQPVVAPAAADAALGAERVARELEDRARVVVEAAHQRRRRSRRRRRPRRAARGPAAKCSASSASRRSSSRGASAMTSRVPGWSASKARSGLRSIRSRTSSESSASCARRCACSSLAVGARAPRACRGSRAAGARRARRARSSSVGEQEDRLGVDGRVVGADRLGADLPELAVAAGLRRARGGRTARRYQSFTGCGSLCMPCSR